MAARLALIACALVALLAVPPALADNGGVAPVSPASPNAEGISSSYWFIFAFTVAIFVLVEGLLIAFVVRYRRRNRARSADGAQIHGANRLELAWTVGPVLVLVAIAAFILVKLPGIQDVPASASGDEALEIEVTGQQFAWTFEYPNGVIAVNRLVAPVGETVRLRVTAPEWDVIHSWWIPALGGKIDAIPGQVNETWFQAQRAGVFRGQCAELCGVQHAVMRAEVEALPKAKFEAWLAERRAGQSAEGLALGEETWKGVCLTCHRLQPEERLIGPSLSPASLSDAERIETVVRNGQRQMPAVGRDWSDEQIDALTTYLQEEFGNGG